MAKRKLYPGTKEAELERKRKQNMDDEPDFVGGSPNYEKFKGWTPEEVLVFLNID